MASRWLNGAAGSLALLGLVCGGCDDGRFDDYPEGTIDPADVEEVQVLASFSAPRMYALGYLPIVFGETAQVCETPPGGGEPVCMPSGNGCPEVIETEDSITVEGGCTDDDGDVFSGRVVARGLTRDADGNLDIGVQPVEVSYESFSVESMSDCPTADGTSVVTYEGRFGAVEVADTTEFDLDMSVQGSGLTDECERVEDLTGDYVYAGTVRVIGDAQTWDGSGTVGNSIQGRFDVSTADEVIDESICRHEALSGQTTIAGANTVVYTYDGETDCDDTSTVTWTFDGEEQGEIEGVRCAASPGGSRGPGAAVALLGLLALGWLMRRRG